MLLYIFCTHHMILERFSIYLFPYAMVLLPKLAASFLPAEGTSPTLPHKQRQREKQQLEQQRYLAMLAIVIVGAGRFWLSAVCFPAGAATAFIRSTRTYRCGASRSRDGDEGRIISPLYFLFCPFMVY